MTAALVQCVEGRCLEGNASDVSFDPNRCKWPSFGPACRECPPDSDALGPDCILCEDGRTIYIGYAAIYLGCLLLLLAFLTTGSSLPLFALKLIELAQVSVYLLPDEHALSPLFQLLSYSSHGTFRACVLGKREPTGAAFASLGVVPLLLAIGFAIALGRYVYATRCRCRCAADAPPAFTDDGNPGALVGRRASSELPQPGAERVSHGSWTRGSYGDSERESSSRREEEREASFDRVSQLRENSKTMPRLPVARSNTPTTLAAAAAAAARAAEGSPELGEGTRSAQARARSSQRTSAADSGQAGWDGRRGACLVRRCVVFGPHSAEVHAAPARGGGASARCSVRAATSWSHQCSTRRRSRC